MIQLMDQIICIFCGEKADIKTHDGNSKTVCSYCNRETELKEYEKILNRWWESLK